MKIKLTVDSDHIDIDMLSKLTTDLRAWIDSWSVENQISVKLNHIKNNSTSPEVIQLVRERHVKILAAVSANIGKSVTEALQKEQIDVKAIVSLCYRCGGMQGYADFKNVYTTIESLISLKKFKQVGKKIAEEIRKGNINATKFSAGLRYTLTN